MDAHLEMRADMDMILHLNDFRSETEGEYCNTERDVIIWKINKINDDIFMH